MIGKGKANKPTYKVNKKFEYYKSTSLLNKYFRRVREENATQSKEKNSTTNHYDKWGTWSDRIGVLINIFLAALTYFLLQQAVTQNKAALDSAKAALQSIELAKKEAKENQDNFEETIRIANANLETQIESVKTTQKQFEIFNEPYLQIINPTITPFEVGKDIGVEYMITNIGNYPVKITRSRIMMAIKVIPPNDFNELDSKIAINNQNLINNYILKGTVIPQSYGFSRNISALDYDYITSKNLFIYFSGIIEYNDLIFNKKRAYKFQIKFMPIGNLFNPVFIINENIRM